MSKLQEIPFTPTPVFDAAAAGSFKLTLTGEVTSSTFVNGSAGPDLVAFRIVQDAAGGHPFAWPENVRNAPAVNPSPNAETRQLFLLNTDGGLDAIGIATYDIPARN
jgi:hypothetical protein